MKYRTQTFDIYVSVCLQSWNTSEAKKVLSLMGKNRFKLKHKDEFCLPVISLVLMRYRDINNPKTSGFVFFELGKRDSNWERDVG